MRRWLTISATALLTWLVVTAVAVVVWERSTWQTGPVTKPQTAAIDRPVTKTEPPMYGSGAGSSPVAARPAGPPKYGYSGGELALPAGGRLDAQAPAYADRLGDTPLRHDPRIGDLNRELTSDKGCLTNDIPTKLTVFEGHRVTVTVTRGSMAEKLIQSIRDQSVEIVPIADFMMVALYGDRDVFEIETLSPNSLQSLKRSESVAWEFVVTPKRGGKHVLEIRVSLYDNPGFSPVSVYKRDVDVFIPFSSKLSMMWHDYGGNWFLTVMLAPFASAMVSGVMVARYTQVPAPSKTPKRPKAQRAATRRSTGSGNAPHRNKEC